MHLSHDPSRTTSRPVPLPISSTAIWFLLVPVPYPQFISLRFLSPESIQRMTRFGSPSSTGCSARTYFRTFCFPIVSLLLGCCFGCPGLRSDLAALQAAKDAMSIRKHNPDKEGQMPSTQKGALNSTAAAACLDGFSRAAILQLDRVPHIEERDTKQISEDATRMNRYGVSF